MNAQYSETTELSLPALRQTFSNLKLAYEAEPYSPIADRMVRLNTLKTRLLESETLLVEALKQDYGYRSDFDSTICDLMPAIHHINYTLKKLPKWVKPQRRAAGIMLLPSKVAVHYQPLGVVGIMVPWNFPIVLSIAPIATALAAGNRMMVKLSENTPHTNKVLTQILAEFEDHIQCIEGEAEISSHFSALPFDHILFTGSTAVGKLVAKAAAENLTPITLELGGKSPVIIAPDADLKKAVDAILVGKSINAGQICIAPDYVMLPKGKETQFVDLYLKKFQKIYIKKGKVKGVSHIINDRQHQRLLNVLEDAAAQGAKLQTIDRQKLTIEGANESAADELSKSRLMLPHLLTEISDQMLAMKEEIFGPILPVMTYDKLEECTQYINQRPRPLALYLLTNDPHIKRDILDKTHSGSVGINETLLQISADDAPFGGVGQSGIGRYHGVEGFQTFSHAKTVLWTASWLPRARIMMRYQELLLKTLKRLFLSK